MARNIKSILGKKGWTGVEVGKALVASIIHDIKHHLDPDYKPLFSQSEFDMMESSLSTEKDYLAYGIYKDIYNGLIDAFNKRQWQYQIFYNGCHHYVVCLNEAINADNVLETAEFIPYVMTKEEYNEIKEETEIRLKSYTESFSSLFFIVLSVFMENLNTAPDNIKKAIKSTKEEAVTNKRILENYNRVFERGYRQLADGTRSDQLQSEDWTNKFQSAYLQSHKFYVNGKPASFEDTLQHYKEKQLFKGYKLLFEGIDAVKKLYKEHTGKELRQEDAAGIMQSLENFIYLGAPIPETNFGDDSIPPHPDSIQINDLLEDQFSSVVKCYYYTDPPTDITKFHIIEDALCFYNGEKSEDNKPNLKEFKEDYPILYKALEAYIKEFVPQTKDLKPSQYNKDIVSWGNLAKLGIGKYTTLTTANKDTIAETLAQKDKKETLELFLKRRRILKNGIVIAKEPSECQLDEDGKYIDNVKNILMTTAPDSIDSIAQDESIKENIIECQENFCKPALRYLYALNALVTILGDIYDLNDIYDVAQTPILCETQLGAMNNMIYEFYTNVYGTHEEKERKRKLIKKIFSPMDYEELKPTKETIEAVATELDKLGFSTETRKKLKNFDSLINKLCERGS